MGRWATGSAAALIVLALLAGCGEQTRDRSEALPEPGGLAVGLSEANARLLAPPPRGTPRQPAFTAWRERVAAIAPAYVRLTVVWHQVQPTRAVSPDFAMADSGCLREVQPCSPYAGLRDRLAAVRALGARPVITIYSTPEWAAADPYGCEPDRSGTVGGMPEPDAYRVLVRALLDFTAEEGVPIAAWGPWNEPNHPAFLNPQRAVCDPTSAPLSPERYAQLVDIFREEAGPDAPLLLGEVAGYESPRGTAAGAAEFAAALPRETACAAEVFALHSYVGSPRDREGEAPLVGQPARAGDLDIVDDVTKALDGHRCERPHRLWITETGVIGEERRAVQGCREMHAALSAWNAHPRVDAAFQYTIREDPFFRSGLAPARLGEPYPVFAAWAAWGGRDPREPEPSDPC
ncbi:MAG TPA: hypothetical protein VGW11_11135 [Solirubrobacteraceae bacterium]|nr:hypothetical protein [Solirubrobacteraceae bacterium]